MIGALARSRVKRGGGHAQTMAASNIPAAPASGSATPGRATAATAAVGASGQGEVKSAPEMPVTKGFEQLNSAAMDAEFMGLPEAKGTGERKQDTATKKAPKPEPDSEDEDEESETEEEDEDEETDADAEEEDEESESDDEDGEADPDAEEEDEESESDDEDGESDADEEEEGEAFKGKKGLRKRFNQLLKENPKLKRENKSLTERLEAMSQQPEVVMSADKGNPLARARTDAEVDEMATNLKTGAQSKLRWLNKHSEGGVWQEGTENEVTMTAEQVEESIEHYEGVMESLDTAKTGRKAWLKTYGETTKTLGAESVTELVKPKVTTRESELFKQVPELMRDPAFLQVLSDAKAGRELREKRGKGIKIVEVKPPAKKGQGEKSAKTQTLESSKARDRPKEAKPAEGKLTSKQLEQLRGSAQDGNRRSQAAIDAAFLG